MKKKKIIKYGTIVIVIIGIIIGSILLFINKNRKEVPVYSMNELAMDNYWENSSNSEGMVTEDKMQSVYLSSTQQVEKIAVTEGQHVKKGDVLLKYSTTLSNIELERKDLEIKKLELELNKAQKELEQIKNYQPGVPTYGSIAEETTPTPQISRGNLISLSNPEPSVETEMSPAPLTGNGTEEKPYMFIWEDGKEYDNIFIEALMNRAGENKTEVVALFMVRENNSYKGDLKKATKIKFIKKESGYSFSILEVYSGEDDPLYPDGNTIVEPDNSMMPEVGPIYTSSEIQRMTIDKEKEISEINLSIKVARNEYKNLKKELNDTTVYSKYDGTVKKVLSLEDDEINTKPIIVVSSGGGYNIQGSIGEFDLENISIGQEVNVQSYETGTFAVGKITKISEYPSTSNFYYGLGNSNVSYYPYTVSVSEDENFREGEYVNLSIVQNEQTFNSFYLVGAFIVSENGKNYVYVAGKDDKLERREVSIGKNMQGMLEVKGGITRDDKLAFPYGKNIKEGSKIREASIDELYMGY